MTSQPRPGIKKANWALFPRPRHVTLWSCNDYRVQRMLERADVMSEGASRKDEDSSTYYGTTSILLVLRSEGGDIPDDLHDQALLVLRNDPHLRLRALRLACREAQLRSSGRLGRIMAELTFSRVAKGVMIDVDVEAQERAEIAPASCHG